MEFALIIPIFLLMMFSLFDIGRLVYINNALSEASREGSRYGSVASRAYTASDRSAIGAWTADSMTAVPGPTVSVSCEREGAAVSTCRSGDVLVVSTESRVEMIVPCLGRVIDVLLGRPFGPCSGPVDLAAQSRVRVQQ